MVIIKIRSLLDSVPPPSRLSVGLGLIQELCGPPANQIRWLPLAPTGPIPIGVGWPWPYHSLTTILVFD